LFVLGGETDVPDSTSLFTDGRDCAELLQARPREGRRRVTPRQKPDETSSRTDAAASATQAPMTIELTITPAQAAQNCAGQLGRNYGPCRDQIALVDQRQSGIPVAAPGATAVMAAARAVAVMVVLVVLAMLGGGGGGDGGAGGAGGAGGGCK
jgi:hypothetical protein